MSKKRILVWETLATVSGGQKMTLTVMDMLSDQYEFCCLIPAEGMLSQELQRRNIPYVLMGDQSLPTGVKGKQVLFRYAWMSVKNVWKSLKAIWKYKPEILYCPGPAALPWSAVCGMITRKPVVWHLHHIFLDGATKKLLNICGKWKCVKKVIAVSNCVGDQIIAPSAHEKIEVLYNPVDVQKYANGHPERILEEIETKLNRTIVRGGVLLLTHIGAITKNKCQKTFVQVVHELKTRSIAVIGLMIGDAITGADQQYKQEIKRYIHENELENDVYIPGFRKDIADILAATHCVLVPSSEGMPLTVLEAMSSKTHIVGRDSGGTQELLEAADCGVTYPSNGTEADIADAIEKAMKEAPDKLQAGYDFCMQLNDAKYKERLVQIFK